jgi:hypothetical protein
MPDGDQLLSIQPALRRLGVRVTEPTGTGESPPDDQETVDQGDTPIDITYWFLPLPQSLSLPDGLILDHEFAHDESAHVAYVSVRFHQRTAPSALGGILDLLYGVMHDAFPTMPPRTGADPLEVEQFLTIAELAVQFRPDPEADEDLYSVGFDEGLNFIAKIQRAYHLATQARVDVIQREKLPFVVPMAHRRTTNGHDGWPESAGIYIANTSIQDIAEAEELTEQQIGAFRHAMRNQDDPFSAYADIRREARVNLVRGDYGPSAVLMATAGEVFLDTLLLSMAWEEGLAATDAVTFYRSKRGDRGLVTRVKSDYSPRLGGQWNTDSDGPVGRWHARTAGLRNRVAHGGYRCSHDEVGASYEALIGLERYVADLLFKRLNTYPRTAWVLSGGPGLGRRGLSAKRIEELAEASGSEGWSPAFRTWRSDVEERRTDD